MPALKFLGRRWLTASDDFVFSPLIFSLSRVILLLILLYRLGWSCTSLVQDWRDTFNFSPSSTAQVSKPIPLADQQHMVAHLSVVEVYVVCLFIIESACTINEAVLALSSLRGSILEVSPRYPLVPVVLTLRVLILIWFELGIAIFGAVVMNRSCMSDPAMRGHEGETFEFRVTTLRLATLAQFGYVFLILLALVFFFDPAGGTQHKTGGGNWSKRCRFCFFWIWFQNTTCASCCKYDKDSAQEKKARNKIEFSMAFTSVAELFANMFQNTDLVPTDIAAGLILLRKKQKQKAKEATLDRSMRSMSMSRGLKDTLTKTGSTLSTQNTNQLPSLRQEDYDVLAELDYYVNFIVGAYGWPMTIMAKPAGCCAHLCGNCFCGKPPTKKLTELPPTIVGDSCCHCNSAAIFGWIKDIRHHSWVEDPKFARHSRPPNEPPTSSSPSFAQWTEESNPNPSFSSPQPAHQSCPSAEIDILFYDRRNDIFKLPYYIARDDSKKVLVVCIRGTLSIQDAFTDLAAKEAALEIKLPQRQQQAGTMNSDAGRRRRSTQQDRDEATNMNEGQDRDEATGIEGAMKSSSSYTEDDTELEPQDGVVKGFAHAGMVNSAKEIYECLTSTGLDAGESSSSKYSSLTNIHDLMARHGEDYSLVITGHSLGGGVAAILGLMFYRDFRRQLKVFSYSPPGGTLSSNLAKLSERFTVSAIVGKDVVPRLGEVVVAKLRDEMVGALAESRRAKATILCTCCTGSANFLFNSNTNAEDISTSLMMGRGIEEGPALDEAEQTMSQHFVRTLKDEQRAEMFPPGVIWHFQKTHSVKTGCCGGRQQEYYPVKGVDPKTHFKELLVSPVMIRDHMPFYVMDVIRRVRDRAWTGELEYLADTAGPGNLMLADSDDESDTDSVILDTGNISPTRAREQGLLLL